MKQFILTFLLISFSIFSGSVFGQDTKKDDSKLPDVKERVSLMEERMQRIEVRMKAESELRDQAMAEAKKELANAKKLLSQGKENDAHSSLIKARHHLQSISGMGQSNKMGPKGKRGKHRASCDCSMDRGFGFGAPPWAGENHPHGFGPRWMDDRRDSKKD